MADPHRQVRLQVHDFADDERLFPHGASWVRPSKPRLLKCGRYPRTARSTNRMIREVNHVRAANQGPFLCQAASRSCGKRALEKLDAHRTIRSELSRFQGTEHVVRRHGGARTPDTLGRLLLVRRDGARRHAVVVGNPHLSPRTDHGRTPGEAPRGGTGALQVRTDVLARLVWRVALVATRAAMPYGIIASSLLYDTAGIVVLPAIGANVYWISLLMKMRQLLGRSEALAAA